MKVRGPAAISRLCATLTDGNDPEDPGALGCDGSKVLSVEEVLPDMEALEDEKDVVAEGYEVALLSEGVPCVRARSWITVLEERS